MAFVESVIDKPSSDSAEETIIAATTHAVVESASALLESVKETVAAAAETVKEELVAPVTDAIEQILEEASDKVAHVFETQHKEEEPKTEQIEETIALLDQVNQGVLPSDESSENLETSPVVAASPVDVPAVDDVKPDDISSLPLPQESFESLSSPPTSHNDSQSDNSFPPPPPPETLVEPPVVVDDEQKKVEEPAEDKVILNKTPKNHIVFTRTD